MELKVKTSVLQEMVGKAIHCVSNNKLIPLTSLMSIKVSNNTLTLTTTDATNYFYVTYPDKVYCDDFEVSVIADTFTKLVQKTTSEEITIMLDNALLTVKGNGSYSMELPLDDGMPIKFPKKGIDEFSNPFGEIKLSTVKSIIATNKASLAVNQNVPVLTYYYCGESVITSDKKKICKTNIPMFEKPVLLSPILMDLLGSLSEETIEVTTTGTELLFKTMNDTIYAPIVEGVETFPVAAIDGLVAQSFKSMCKLPKTAVLNVLDRLSLFVAPYDKNAIYLTFKQDGVMFSSKKQRGEETIPYLSSIGFEAYTCSINIEMLKSQILTIEGDEIELHYGSEVAVKLINKNTIQLVALLNDDRLEEE